MPSTLEIIKGFLSTLPEKPGLIVVHSSIIHLKVNTDSFKWNFLKSIKKLVQAGYTFAFPSFTFSFCTTGFFDVLQSKSEVGILADWVSELYDSIRTKHPIYSHVLIGRCANKALNYSSVSCFGNDSIYNFFEANNATICMFGCGWSYCTPFHYFEEKSTVPYRYYKNFIAKNDPQQKATMYVRDLTSNPVNDFSSAIKLLEKQDKITIGDIDECLIQSTPFDSLGAICLESLSTDPYCYVKSPKKVRSKISKVSESASTEKLKIAILANSNFEQLGTIFKEYFTELCSTRQLDFYQNSYAQMSSDIITGKISSFNPNYCFLPSRLEDIYNVSDLEFADIDNHSLLENYFELIKKINDQVKRKAFVHLFPLITHTTQGSVLIGKNKSLYKFVNEANLNLIDRTADLTNIKLVSPEMIGKSPLLCDPRLWYLGRIPYSVDVFHEFSKTYCGYILNDLGKTARLLILDLDNTLWGGVLGEDGLNGINLGGDFPGNSFKEFQKTIVSLKNRGIAIALVSKNDEDLALNCIENHPEMLIRKSDLAAYKINWQEKYLNIKEITEEVGLDFSNVMFIDDNPVECEKVRINLPDVTVLELPKDPSLYRQVLIQSPFISVTDITEEDKNRSNNYVNKRLFTEEQNTFESIEDFLSSLEIKIRFNPLTDFNFTRCLQLINKTNQFNTTTKRYTEKSLNDMQNSKDFYIGILEYSDQLTEPENIGVFILEEKNCGMRIDSLLLSCRVLGRGLEDAIISWIVNYSRNKGFDCILGEIIKTPRNTPVREIYKKRGFVEYTPGTWRFKTSNDIDTPHYLQVIGI